MSALQEGLGDDRSWARAISARGLGRCATVSARPALLQRALDPGEKRWVRAAAARALGAVGGPSDEDETREGLLGLARGPGLEPEIRLAALDALARASPPVCDGLRALVFDDELLVAARAQSILSDHCTQEELQEGEG